MLHDQLEEEGRSPKDVKQIVSTQAVELPVSKEVVARLLAMPRPSFSRELINMEREGLIRVSGRVIWLLDPDGLERGVIEGFSVLTSRYRRVCAFLTLVPMINWLWEE